MSAPPVDFVYTWVDGQENAALRQAYEAGTEGNGQNRFRDNSELRHSIASVHAYAPWVRRIYVVAAAGQYPQWLREHPDPKVEVVPHSAFFGACADGLPVFNSHAIEAVLHQIPGLAEHFVYFNDDMFLGAPIRAEDFFPQSGQALVRISERIRPSWSSHPKLWRVYRGHVLELLHELYPKAAVYNTAHQARSQLKSVCEQAWTEPRLRPALERTARSRFRSRADVAPTELYSNLMLLQERARPIKAEGRVLCVFDHSVLGPEFYVLQHERPQFYCINDDMDDPSPAQLARLHHHLAHGLPHQGAQGRPGHPILGRLGHELTHALSWFNRQRKKS